MASNTRLFDELKSAARRPEMRIFWFSTPFLIAIFILNVIYLPAFLIFMGGGLLALVAAVVFASSYRVARLNQSIAIEQSELRGIISSLEDALIAYDQNFNVLFFNPAAERLFKLEQEKVLAHRLEPQDIERPEWNLLAQAVFPSLAPGMVARSRAGVYPQVVDISFSDPVLELRVVTSPISDGRGGVLGFMKIVHDRTREALLIKSKSEFLTVASHQLRGPLTNISWALQTLSEDKTVSGESASLVESARTATRQLLMIIEDLLNVTKIEEGHFGYTFQPLNLVAFIEKVLEGALPQARRTGVALYLEKPNEPIPELSADPQKLSMVMSNLLDNAIRYNIPSGEVVVRAHRVPQQPFVEVAVKDSGIGIPQDQIGKIFSKFFRADNALKFQTEGSGLGLYIAKNIIQAHGGQMWAESEEKRGSVFRFTLPTDPTLIPSREAAQGY